MNEKLAFALSAALVLFLAGCSATHSDLAGADLTESEATASQSAAVETDDSSGVISDAQASTIKRVPFAPTQLGYSLDLLNDTPDSTDYPTISNLKDKDPALLTPEERRNLEAELLKLNERAQQ
ncbi:hypothetical protein [uncultured Cohaesibacter sp.]|uniref:hypothetical protein n=1 Tax=uncultured Cohaesibacter sp. TaxID=1002546 RepID=UPI002AA77AAF|nr:hypothetical protein [uncultured Cohaesibacter sp.]